MDAHSRQPSAEGGMRSPGSMRNPGAPGPTAPPNASTEEARPALTAGVEYGGFGGGTAGALRPPRLKLVLSPFGVEVNPRYHFLTWRDGASNRGMAACSDGTVQRETTPKAIGSRMRLGTGCAGQFRGPHPPDRGTGRRIGEPGTSTRGVANSCERTTKRSASDFNTLTRGPCPGGNYVSQGSFPHFFSPAVSTAASGSA
jgi:hypothetical protein